MKPRAFVSSVMEGYGDYRNAAREAVIACDGEPVLIEDFPALDSSPRSACLDGVMSSDVLITVIGHRGGWTTPSGKLAVEEEYEEARKRGKRNLVFVHEGPRDADAQRLADRLSDYVDGQLRPTFSTPADLKRAIEAALPDKFRTIRMEPIDVSDIEGFFAKPHVIYDHPTLRVVVMPERKDQLIDPVGLDEPELLDAIYAAGHSARVRLLSYERRKTAKVGIKELVVEQVDDGNWREGREEVRLEIRTDGTIIVDANATGRRPDRTLGMATMRVVDNEVADLLTSALRFSGSFLDSQDRFKRFDRFFFNASLANLGYSSFGPALAPGTNRMTMGDHGDRVHIAFEPAKLIRREDLSSPDQLVADSVKMFSRRLRSREA
ncbi:MAG: DUF4062 domain-containing protein [Gemmatimonadota bacterium]